MGFAAHNSLFFRMARPTIPWVHFYGLCWPWLIGRSPCFQKWLGPKSPGPIFTGFFSHRPLFLKKPWPQCHWAHCYGFCWPSFVVLQSNLGAQAQNLLLYILSHFKTYREFQAAFPDFGHGVYCTRSCSQIGFPDWGHEVYGLGPCGVSCNRVCESLSQVSVMDSVTQVPSALPKTLFANPRVGSWALLHRASRKWNNVMFTNPSPRLGWEDLLLELSSHFKQCCLWPFHKLKDMINIGVVGSIAEEVVASQENNVCEPHRVKN